MFDIGFFELLLIAVVTLVVVGPKRLPETIHFVGLWSGRIRRSLSAARREFENEFGLDDVRRQLHNEDVMRSLEETRAAEKAAKAPPETENKPAEENSIAPEKEGKPNA